MSQIRLASVGTLLLSSLVMAGPQGPVDPAESKGVVGVRQAPPPSPLPGLEYKTPFFPGANYNANVPTADSVLGFPVGTKSATHAQIEAVVKAIAANSPRCKLFEYGKSHEGRTLYYLVIGTESRIQNLDPLKADLAKLSDPRKVDAGEADRLAGTLPAVAWMAYVIHGDENSGSDAALAVIHHLAASTDDDVRQLLENVLVIVDPLMNPDGRDRWLTMLAQSRTVQPSVDDQSLLHTGFWPSGRMNHYLFDLNRDWIFATQPETRGRMRAVSEWHPHYFMESHEMGSQDTFLFMPGREAVNPNMPENVKKWETRFAQDMASAFDAKGWRYYTGEWNDNWYPGYSSSWAALRGIVENLYEQANLSTDAVRRPEGTLEAYREGVHKQLTGTMANLKFLAANRREVVADYVAEKRRNVGVGVVQAPAPMPGVVVAAPQRTFAIVPSANASRVRVFLDLMNLQGFEVLQAGKAFKASGKDRLGVEVKDREFPAGTILVPGRQPFARLLSAMLEFDPRMKAEFLTEERRELLRFDKSRIYDITGWSLPMLFDVEGYELIGDLADADMQPVADARMPEAVQNTATTVGFVIGGADDRSVAAAGRLMERGVWVRVANKPFKFDGKQFARGSVVITRKDNLNFTGDLTESLREVCAQAGVAAVGVTSGFGPGDLPDLGGEHFVLLHPAKIAVLAREPFGPYSYGAAWYTIDHVLGLRASYLDFNQVSGADLRRYNVIVIPDGNAAPLAAKMEDLKSWVQGGGTLIAIGGTAGAIAKEKDGIGKARVLPDVLTKPEAYIQAVIRDWEGHQNVPDPEAVWSFSPPSGEKAVQFPWDGAGAGGGDKPNDDELKRRDEWRKLFMPAGAVLAGRVDDRSFLTAGCGEYVPVMYVGDSVLVTPPGVHAPVRMGHFVPAPLEPEKAVEEKTDAKSEAKPKPTENGKAKADEKAKVGEDPKAEAKEDDDDDDDKDAKDKKKDEKPKPGWTISPKGYEMRLRMSGLLWPEAAERIANSAYVTRERIGNGQVILFASEPNFRAATLGTQRIFMNAVVCGPGMGTSQPIRP